MDITLNRVDDAFRLEAVNDRGNIVHTDGSPAIGGSEQGWRPMELLLVSLASCSAIDIINILKKQRQTIDSFAIKIGGVKKDGIPSPYERIDLHLIMSGKIKSEKVEKAIALTTSKYCSVYFSLHPDIELNYTYELAGNERKTH